MMPIIFLGASLNIAGVPSDFTGHATYASLSRDADDLPIMIRKEIITSPKQRHNILIWRYHFAVLA